MVTSLPNVLLDFPPGFQGDSEKQVAISWEATVRLPDGARYLVNFAEAKRIEEEIMVASPGGRPYFAKPGLIVVEKVTAQIADLAICWAISQDYILHVQPILSTMPPISSKVISIKFGENEAESLEEARDRGHLEDVRVQMEDGSLFKAAFIDPMRLRREIDLDSKNGRPFYVEPGLIVVEDLTKDLMSQAHRNLASDGYFAHLEPRGQ